MNTLRKFVADFSESIMKIDKEVPPAKNVKTGIEYDRGIGPYQEKLLVQYIIQDLKKKNPTEYSQLIPEVKYPNDRKKCDIVLNNKLFIEVKGVRKMRNNGVHEEFLVNHILSPYEADKSFLTDTKKLLDSGFQGEKSVLMYGYDYENFSLDLILGCFELLAEKYFCRIVETYESRFDGLIHPIHKRGKVKAYLIENI